MRYATSLANEHTVLEPPTPSAQACPYAVALSQGGAAVGANPVIGKAEELKEGLAGGLGSVEGSLKACTARRGRWVGRG